MPQTPILPELKKQALSKLENGKNLFIGWDAHAAQQILTCWQEALPYCRTELEAFLNEEAQLFLLDFLGADGVQLFKDLPQTITPWSVKDMNLYYDCRNDSSEIANMHVERRQIVIKQQPFSLFDDYQLYRDTDTAIIERRGGYQRELNKLVLLSQSYALVRAIDAPCHEEEYYFEMLIRLLAIFRVRLTKVHSSEDEAKQSELITNSPEAIDLIAHIDAINELIAINFADKISCYKVASENELLSKTLTQLGALDEEIFPWLGVYFKRGLLNTPPAEKEKSMDEFFAFHALLRPQNVHELISGIIGTSYKNLMVNYIKSEENTWLVIADKPIEIKLRHIKKYLLQYRLSDWVTLNICMDFYKQAQNQNKNIDFEILAYKLFARVKSERHFLPRSFDYIRILRLQLQNDTNLSNKLKSRCPLFYISVVSYNDEEVITNAKELRVLPPNAEIFYKLINDDGSLENSLPVSEYVKENSLEDNCKLFSEIFYNDNYLPQYLAFIQSNAAKSLGLTPAQFPLLSENISAGMWEQIIDSGMLLETPFFASDLRIKLFETINTIKDELVTSEKILNFPKRYRDLAIALCIYQATAASVFDPVNPMLALLTGGPSVTVPNEAKWAEKIYQTILCKVAYSQDSKIMNFNRIVRFLDLEIDLPNELPIDSRESLSKAIQDGVINFYLTHTEINCFYQQKLLHSFTCLFVREKKVIDPDRAKSILGYPLHTLPTVALQWLDFFLMPSVYVLPPYATDLRRVKIEKAQTIAQQQNALNNAIGRMLDDLTEDATNSFSCIFSSQKQRNANLLTSLDFMMSLYHAYCLEKNEVLHNNFIMFAEIPLALHKDFQAALTRVETKLTKEEPSKNIFTRKKDKIIEAQLAHRCDLAKRLNKIFVSLMDEVELQTFKNEIDNVIKTKKFNNVMFGRDYYQTFLIEFSNLLGSLHTWAQQNKRQNFSYENRTLLSSPAILQRLKTTLPVVSEPELKQDDLHVTIESNNLPSRTISQQEETPRSENVNSTRMRI